MRTIITTVGTSLLTGQERPWAPWRFGMALPNIAEIVDWLHVANPVQASAEVNTWHRLGVFAGLGEERIAILSSNTEEGSLCGQALGKFAEQKGFATEVGSVEGLQYADLRTFAEGLCSLGVMLTKLIQKTQERGDEAVVAASGGFKAETAVCSVIALHLNVPLYYIYETFDTLIKLDRNFFEKIDEVCAEQKEEEHE